MRKRKMGGVQMVRSKGEGLRTVSAYVRETPQIGHSLGSDGLKLHSRKCAHT